MPSPKIASKLLSYGARTALLLLCAMAGCDSNAVAPDNRMTPLPITITGPYSLSASSVVIGNPPERFDLTASIANQGTGSLEVTYGGCWGFYQLYRNAERSGPPVFDSSEFPVGCPLTERTVTVRPGESANLVASGAYPALRTFGVASGRYFVSLRVAPGGNQISVPTGEISIPE